MIRFLPLLATVALSACTSAPAAVTFHAEGYPEKLSDWGLFTVADGRLASRPGIVTYDLATPLFSDYAQKWRTVWMPKGVAASFDPKRPFAMPVGTIVSKTFYYPVAEGTADPQASGTVEMRPAAAGKDGLDTRAVRLMETRLLVRRAAGWVAIPYVWDADGRDATLARTGTDVALTIAQGGKPTRFTYSVPNQNQCAGCHAQDAATRAIEPIGLRARHVADLSGLVNAGYLTGAPAQVTRNADWRDDRQPVEKRARAWLDINCSHCHSQTGPARTSGLWLDTSVADPRLLGACKPPVAAGRGTGDRPFGIVPGRPDHSILAYRLESTDPGAMMPELGRALAHTEGVALVRQWIAEMKGACEASSPAAP